MSETSADYECDSCGQIWYSEYTPDACTECGGKEIHPVIMEADSLQSQIRVLKDQAIERENIIKDLVEKLHNAEKEHDELSRELFSAQQSAVSTWDELNEYHKVAEHMLTGECSDDLDKRVLELRLEIQELKSASYKAVDKEMYYRLFSESQYNKFNARLFRDLLSKIYNRLNREGIEPTGTETAMIIDIMTMIEEVGIDRTFPKAVEPRLPDYAKLNRLKEIGDYDDIIFCQTYIIELEKEEKAQQAEIEQLSKDRYEAAVKLSQAETRIAELEEDADINKIFPNASISVDALKNIMDDNKELRKENAYLRAQWNVDVMLLTNERKKIKKLSDVINSVRDALKHNHEYSSRTLFVRSIHRAMGESDESKA
jgi:hypothetical protein